MNGESNIELTNQEMKLLGAYSKRTEISELEKIKLVYGWRLLVSDLKKIVFVYGLAMILGCLLEVIIMHASFYVIRQVAFGVHSGSFGVCLALSCIVFPFGALLLKSLDLQEIHIWSGYFIASIILCLFAPIGSEVNKIRGNTHRRYLRKRMYVRLGMLGVALLVIPMTITKFVVAGILIEAVVIIISLYKGD